MNTYRYTYIYMIVCAFMKGSKSLDTELLPGVLMLQEGVCSPRRGRKGC